MERNSNSRIIDTKDLDKARSLIKLNPNSIVKAQGDEFNRAILQKGGFKILLGVELNPQKASLRQLNSGWNDVLAKLAKQHNISLGLDIKSLRNSSKVNQAEIIARVSQNILICRKFGVKLAYSKEEDKNLLSGFLMSLGASTSQVSEAISF